MKFQVIQRNWNEDAKKLDSWLILYFVSWLSKGRKDDRAQETDCWARSSPGSICKIYLVLMLVRISLMIINHFIINAGLLGASEYERRVIQSL